VIRLFNLPIKSAPARALRLLVGGTDRADPSRNQTALKNDRADLAKDQAALKADQAAIAKEKADDGQSWLSASWRRSGAFVFRLGPVSSRNIVCGYRYHTKPGRTAPVGGTSRYQLSLVHERRGVDEGRTTLHLTLAAGPKRGEPSCGDNGGAKSRTAS
jgi:hypothetical protein